MIRLEEIEEGFNRNEFFLEYQPWGEDRPRRCHPGGGANLAILSRCPIGMVKLDRSLIAQITADGPRPEWLDGIAALIWSSGMTAIAEGVETENPLEVLFDAGIQAAQGFLFARPMLSHDLIAFHQQANGLNSTTGQPANE